MLKVLEQMVCQLLTDELLELLSATKNSDGRPLVSSSPLIVLFILLSTQINHN